jgi:hypothetical protein
MISKLDKSAGSAVGYKLSGAIDKQDYAVMVPELEQLVAEHGTVQLLCDLSDFTSERPSAWGDDLRFGREFHKKITKMAIVGDGHWEKLVADLAHPFYAQEAKYFHTEDEAWEWLTS